MKKNLLRGLGAAVATGLIAFAWSAAAKTRAPAVTPVDGAPMLIWNDPGLAKRGYALQEYFVSGEAESYAPQGPVRTDGQWTVKPSGKAPYTTRFVVIRPTDPARFNGTVLVEWLNVSGGTDAAPDWIMAHREIVRSGYAYVGVSAQRAGVSGGGFSLRDVDNSLKKLRPDRYGPLDHPGDSYSFAMFSQIGNLFRKPSGLLGGLKPQRVIALGESQSAFFLTTYANAVDPLAKVFDGFFIHSRFGGAARLDGASIIEASHDGSFPHVVKHRTDLRVPVLTVITETDLMVGGERTGYVAARQPDGPNLRVWEIAGTAHADTYTAVASAVDTGDAKPEDVVAALRPPPSIYGVELKQPINAAPQHHYVVEAALRSLDRWVRSGKPAPTSPRLEVAGTALAQDGYGLALGGIRSPWVDAPVARLSGEAPPDSPRLASLFGSTHPFDAATLARRYPGGKADYLRDFEASLDRAIAAGFILSDDRAEILRLAPLMYPE